MKSKYMALFLGWLVPGMGHIYAGKRQKGIIFFVAIAGAAVTGIALGRFRNVYFAPDHYQFYAEVGNGLFTLLASLAMAVTRRAPAETVMSAAQLADTVPVADLYCMIAGLLNFVVAANAFDAAAAESRGGR